MERYLQDKAFLKELCSRRHREVFARITSLTKEGFPVKRIEGKATSGSVNIDGASSVRRTCSVSLIAQDLNIHDFYWGLNTRFALEVGLRNTLDQYIECDVIWFPMGEFLISSFSTSLSTTGRTINISGKDKMCQLNGDMGGKLNASTDFGTEDITQEDGTVVNQKIPIQRIIRELVHTYGEEDYSRIIINDIDTYGLDLETYRGDVSLYMFVPAEDNTQAINYTFDGTMDVYIGGKDNPKKLQELTEKELFYQNGITSEMAKVSLKADPNSKKYYIRKLQYGDTAGYKLSELIYPGDLIANVGEAATSILDKIKNMLGDFEYFYDVYGNFIFQRQRAYRSTEGLMKTPDADGLIRDYSEDIDFVFENLNLITSISNSPQINNIKNDYTIWGTRTSAAGGDVPIHLRYAIDEKPTRYVAFRIDENKQKLLQREYPELYKNLETREERAYTIENWDWREILYQMALDYRKFNQADEYAVWLAEANPWCYNGKTGYEQYYTDIEGFWRQLYKIDPDEVNVEEQLQEGVGYIDRDALENGSKDFQYRCYDLQDASQIYLYGPRVEDGDGGYKQREYYGQLSSIIRNNYRILQRYLSTASGMVAEKDFGTLYYYDANSCKRVDENIVACVGEEKYHALDTGGKTKEFMVWTDRDKKIAETKTVDFFEEPAEWYFKRGDSFISLGTYYPLEENEEIYQPSDKFFTAAELTIEMKKKDKDNKEIAPLIPKEKKLDLTNVNNRKLTFNTIKADPTLFQEPELDPNQVLLRQILQGNMVTWPDNFDYDTHWNHAIERAPEILNFWIDFLDGEGSNLLQYSVRNIGQRPYAKSDNQVKAIQYLPTLNNIFIDYEGVLTTEEDITKYWGSTDFKTGYNYLRVGEQFQSFFTISSQGKSAYDALENLIYNNAYCNESVSISCIPQYFLEPNTKIAIYDNDSGVNGEYILTKITIPLAYNGTMSLTTNRAINKYDREVIISGK